MNIRASIRRLLALSFLIGCLLGQKYDVKLWGIKVGTAIIAEESGSDITLNIQALDFINNFYPVELEFYTKYDTSDYTVVEMSKNVQQGDYREKYNVKYLNNGYAVYNDEDTLQTNSNTHSFLSLLFRIVESPVDSIDTKWFNLENEGILYKARLLWNDTTTFVINNNKYICDHYRFDLEITDDSSKMFDETDYFNDLFFDINSIRQIWVENWQKQKRLIKLTLKNSLINLEMVIAD